MNVLSWSLALKKKKENGRKQDIGKKNVIIPVKINQGKKREQFPRK